MSIIPIGMRYPQPKTRDELMRHPQRPSDARIDELREPFKDATDVKVGSESETKDPALRTLEMGFHTQLPVGSLFGALKPVSFEREFQLKLVGNRTTLPRGNLTTGGKHDVDHDCFQSVFIGGEKQAKMMKDAMLQERKDWLDKVVVDNLTIKVGPFLLLLFLLAVS